MQKTLIYTRPTEECYLDYSDEYEIYGEEFEYTVYEDDLLRAVVDLVFRDNFTNTPLYGNADYGFYAREGIKEFIITCGLLEELVDYYDDEFKEYFEDDAMYDGE